MSENQKGFVLQTASKNKQRKPLIFNQFNKHPSSSIYSGLVFSATKQMLIPKLDPPN